MKDKTEISKNVRLFVVLAVFFGLVLAGTYIWADKTKIKETVFVDYPDKLFPIQTEHNCGIYNIALIERILDGKDIDREELAEKAKRTDTGSIKIGELKQLLLENEKISVGVYKLWNISNEKKLQYLKQKLSEGFLVMILGKTKSDSKMGHFITLLGYDQNRNEFYIYDSGLTEGVKGFTIDDNSDLPGNKTYSNKELIEFWGNNGINWYILTAKRR